MEHKNEINLNIDSLVQPQLRDLLMWALDCIVNKKGDWGEITEVVLPGGRGSGKSSFTSTIKILDLLFNGRSNITLMKNEVNLRSAAFSQINKDAARIGLSDQLIPIKRPLEIRSIHGKEIMLFKGAENPESLKSIAIEGEIGICHIEEADRLNSYEDYTEIMASIRGSNYLTVITYNPPRSLNHWITELEKPNKNRIVVYTNYLGMPKEWLGNSAIQRINELKNSSNRKWRDIYRRTYLGERVKTGAEIFTNIFDVELDVYNIDSDEIIVKGMDFGFKRDPTVYILASYNPKLNRIRVYRELRFIQTLISNISIKVLELEHSMPYQDIMIKGDSAAANMIAEMQNNGVYNIEECVKFKNSREYGWRFLELADRIEIDRRYADDFYQECLKAEYPVDKLGNITGNYPEVNDHGIDAIRYALEDIIRQDNIVIVRD